MSRNTGLDLLRTSAILLVLALHASQLAPGRPWLLGYVSAFGWAGVDIFFVLSGFLIANQFFSGKKESSSSSVRGFYVKRWLRTLPLYFFVLTFYVIIKPHLGFPFQGKPWHYAFFLQNYTGVKDFVPSWSLCIEEQFYLLFPFLALAWMRLKLPAWVWLLPAALSLI
ncbi:MAG: acyltransferase family protein, partial [Bdellovibrionota bacterium]